jgi:DTW domain-containing protein YfiP
MLHASLCICSLIEPIETRTRLVLVIHRAELRKSTNTGHLAVACLANSEVVVRGREGAPTPPLELGAGAQPLFLFPHENEAEVLRPGLVSSDRPVTLIVPDGNWRQAARVRARVPGLRDVPCVALPPGEPSRYRLRSEAHPDRLATIEAIARAMEVLEGPHVRRALDHVFWVMVDRTLWVRGSIPGDEVTGGIPPGALRHDP